MKLDGVALSVTIVLFVIVAGIGFGAARWRRVGKLDTLDQWGLGGRAFGGFVTWFLLGGDLYTAYTFIAVPGAMYALGAVSGWFAVAYTVLVWPIVFVLMPRLWSVAHRHGIVTPADFVGTRYGSRGLSLAVAFTGILALLPYIALQLVGIEAVLQVMGVGSGATGIVADLPLIIAFLVLAGYTYTSGLRSAALTAFLKDLLVYVTVLVAVIYIPIRLGGFAHIFAAVSAHAKVVNAVAKAKGLPPTFAIVPSAKSYWAYATTGNEHCSYPVEFLPRGMRGPGSSAPFAITSPGEHCCVGRPVPSRGAHPVHSGGRVEVEQLSEDGGGHSSRQVDQRGSAAGSGVDAEVGEALAELLGAERSSGQVAREQPGRGGRGAGAHVSAASRAQAKGEPAEGFGKDDVIAAQAKVDLAVVGGDLIDGDGDDAAELLAVEQDEASGDSVGQLESVVAQEACDDGPSDVVVERGTVLSPLAGHLERRRGVAVPRGPAEEVTDFGVGGTSGLEEALEAILGEIAEPLSSGIEPRQQGDGSVDAGLGEARVGHLAGVGSATQPAEHNPGGIGVDHAPVIGTLDPIERGLDPALEAGQVLVAWREGAVGDQHAAQVIGRLSLGVGVERLVGDGEPPGGHIGEDRRTLASSEPVEGAEGLAGGGE